MINLVPEGAPDRSTLVVDHIVNNCNMRDRWVAAMLIKGIIARAHLLLPSEVEI